MTLGEKMMAMPIGFQIIRNGTDFTAMINFSFDVTKGEKASHILSVGKNPEEAVDLLIEKIRIEGLSLDVENQVKILNGIGFGKYNHIRKKTFIDNPK